MNEIYRDTTSQTSYRKHRYKIVKPYRFFIFILICITLIVFSAYSIAGSGKADAATVTRYTHVIVQENDTLWDIVETYNPNLDMDTRLALYDLYEMNDIEDAGSIRPGDRILVPIYK